MGHILEQLKRNIVLDGDAIAYIMCVIRGDNKPRFQAFLPRGGELGQAIAMRAIQRRSALSVKQKELGWRR
jgi:hypothetical protein